MRNKLFLAAAVAITMASCKKEAAPAFTADATEVEVGEVVTFTNTSEDSYNQIWDFGDGTQTEAGVQNPSHVYYEAGSYTVNLTATDKKGKEAFSATPVTITVTDPAFDVSEEAWEEEMETAELLVVGDWMLDEYSYIYSSNYDFTIVQNTETTYTSYQHKFTLDHTVIMNDDLGNVSTGSWNLYDSKHIYFNGNVYEVTTLSASAMVFTRVISYETTSGTTSQTYTETETYTFSK